MNRVIRIMVANRLFLVVAAVAILSLLLTGCSSHSISGQVVSEGSGLPGVTMALTMTGSVLNGATPITVGSTGSTSVTKGTVTTDANGNYTFNDLENGMDYTVTASSTTFTFSPSSSAVTIEGSDVTDVNFTASPGSASNSSFSISGAVTEGISGLQGVIMMLNGAGSGTATTDTSGNYTFSGIANGSYTITPDKTGYTFGPPSSVQNINGAITAINFTATPVSTFSIFGTVTSGGLGLPGVNMALSGTNSASTISLFQCH